MPPQGAAATAACLRQKQFTSDEENFWNQKGEAKSTNTWWGNWKARLQRPCVSSYPAFCQHLLTASISSSIVADTTLDTWFVTALTMWLTPTGLTRKLESLMSSWHSIELRSRNVGLVQPRRPQSDEHYRSCTCFQSYSACFLKCQVCRLLAMHRLRALYNAKSASIGCHRIAEVAGHRARHRFHESCCLRSPAAAFPL